MTIGVHRTRKLRELRLEGNQFSRLPDCVPELKGLEVLDLRRNTIENLPLELKYLRSLLDLDLDGNPVGPEVSWKGLGNVVHGGYGPGGLAVITRLLAQGGVTTTSSGQFRLDVK